MLRTPMVGLSLVLVTAPVAAQPAIVAIPPDKVALYHVDFGNFYPSHDAEIADRTETRRLLVELQRFKERVGESAATLLEVLRQSEQVTARFNRHIVYRQLMFAVNTRDTASREQSVRLQSDLDAGTAFVGAEVSRLPARTIDLYRRQAPALHAYAFVISQLQRGRKRLLEPAEEERLARLLVESSDSSSTLYQRAARRVAAASVREVDGKQVSAASLLTHTDEAVREQAWRTRNAAYTGERDALSHALLYLATERNRVAQARGFENGANMMHAELHLETDGVRRLYSTVLQHGELHRRYQRLTVAHSLAGNSTRLAPWNSAFVDPASHVNRYSIDDATRLMLAAAAPLGNGVRSQFASLLDPRNGRLDIAPGSNRAPGAFAWGVPGLMTTFVYQSAYRGSYRDITTLFHEASHALHGELLGGNRRLVSANMGPPFVSEGIAMFFELLLNDHLLAVAPDSAARVELLEQFLWRTMITFNVTRQAAFEQALYDGVQSGRIRSADQLDSVNGVIGRSMSLWYERIPESANDWSSVTQYSSTPLYLPNYVYASVLGLALFGQYKDNPARFTPRFLAFLEGGFPDVPSKLLEKQLAIDIESPGTVKSALELVGTRLQELEMVYRHRK